MTTYSAQVRVEDGMLHTSRPLTAPEPVSDMIESLTYAMRDADDVVSCEVTFETAGESDTPIADSTVGTSSTPLDTPAAAGTPA